MTKKVLSKHQKALNPCNNILDKFGKGILAYHNHILSLSTGCQREDFKNNYPVSIGIKYMVTVFKHNISDIWARVGKHDRGQGLPIPFTLFYQRAQISLIFLDGYHVLYHYSNI